MSKYVAVEIAVPDAVRGQYAIPPFECRLRGLSRLNVFIGPNNSGKSRLLRSLFSQPLKFLPQSLEHDGDFATELGQLLESLKALLGDKPTTQHRGQIERAYDLLSRFGVELSGETATPNWGVWPKLEFPETGEFLRLGWYKSDEMRKWYNHRGGLSQSFLNAANKAAKGTNGASKIKRIYIPSLRGIRSLDPLAHAQRKDLYAETTCSNYEWSGDAIKESVFTGQRLFSEIRRHLLGTLVLRRKIRMFEQFLGDVFFSGREISLIPSEDNYLHVKIGDEAERPVHLLGDGIQHIMIMTFPMFMYRDQPLMLFVEEPELYLHPGFQRIFIDAVLAQPNCCRQVFVSTHSHQFIDITIDTESCSVFRFDKIADTTERDEKIPTSQVTRASGPDFQILADLGVRNSSVLLSNCTIWVEGITDRLYFRRFLELFFDANPDATEWKEDLHYSFVEYGGGNVTHWSFLSDDGTDVERLCGNLMLIADQDGDAKAERHSRLREALGDRFVVLDAREVENLLGPTTIVETVNALEGQKLRWPSFDHETYRMEKIGKFIRHTLAGMKYTSKRRTNNPYEADSGTLKDKVGFCRQAVSELKHWDDLSEQARDIVARMHDFISAKNKPYM